VKPRTSDTVIRPLQVSTLTSLAARESNLLAKNLVIGDCGKRAHRLRLLSADPGRQDVGPNQVPVSFGLGTSRDVSPCDAPPDKHHRYVRPMSASQTLDYDYPYSLAPGTVRETYASREAMGFGTHRLTGEGGAHAHPCLRFGVSHWPLIRDLRPGRGCYPPTRSMRPTSDTPVASPAPVFGGPPFTPSRGSSRARAAETASTAAA